MSAVNALDRLQMYLKDHPTQEVERAAAILRSGAVSSAAFDYEQATAFIRHYPAALNLPEGPRSHRLRAIAAMLVVHLEPTWKWVIPLGRRYLADALSDDARQVFDAAGLYGPADDAAVRSWWDQLAREIRQTDADARLNLGRRGEDLTVAHEIKSLAVANRHDLRPELVGFEDNTLGYDVRSFIVDGGVDRAKYIEVKTTESRPLRFYFSRNEWRAAERYGSDYVIHLWHLPSAKLTEISFEALSNHMPTDRGDGRWETITVRWS